MSKEHVRMAVIACAALLCSTALIGATTDTALMPPSPVVRA